jgi:hypothetical protein
MNTLPKDLEDIIVNYKKDLENFEGLTYNELIKEKLSYKIRLNNELKKEKKNFEELFFFSQKINEIKDKMIVKLDDKDYCNGCKDHHRQEWDICKNCNKQFCDQHFGDECYVCDNCDEIVCNDCSNICICCDNYYCKECERLDESNDRCEHCWENSLGI